jgi:glucans biosynthesis protein
MATVFSGNLGLQRRNFLSHSGKTLGAAALAPALPAWSSLAAAAGLKPVGSAQAFDYPWLKGRARALAEKPYQVRNTTLPPGIDKLSWDQHQAIRFRDDHALWGNDKRRFVAKFFHLGLYFKSPVRMYEVASGQAQELAYDSAMFDYGNSGVKGETLPPDLCFAGFRLNFHTDPVRDVAAFLGASYFRAVGGEWQYGQSARGLAIDTAQAFPEEFPDFIGFWLEQPDPQSSSLTVYALLDSPSISGAYRFVITPGDTQTMDLDVALYPRKVIDRLGIAPCTSMYQTGENDRRMAWDWRPEIHDTDGLAIHSGSGEWIWRPLTNPAQLQFNSFQDTNPRGFGLMQRDRNFDHYQDDGVFYDRRPSLWVQPRGNWGAGAVQLVEIPTVDETFDNIVAFWNPATKPQPGQELLLAYRLYWGGEPPPTRAMPLARCVATYTGLGGVVGQKRNYYARRFAVDFAGGDFALLGDKVKVEAMISVSRGTVELVSARPQGAINGWRAMFDLRPDGDSTAPIDIRMHLQSDGQVLTETWLYQWAPPPVAQRTMY